MSVPHALVDWGTSSFRAWGIDGAGAVTGERRAAQGFATVENGAFEAVLDQHLAALGLAEDAPAILCGMVGARGGWREVPYLDAPARLDALARAALRVEGIGRPVFVLPGLAQRLPNEPDVMRGEETQLWGVVAQGHGTGLVCLPGTHSKWVRLEAGGVEGFSTFVTGETFALLRRHSVLAGALAGTETVDPAHPAFADGVRHALDEPALVSNRVFQLRAGWLLQDRRPAELLAALSGLLVGAEIAGAAARHGALHGVALVASGPIAEVYGRALELAGVDDLRRFDAETCVRRGLGAAASRLIAQGVPA